MEPERAAEAAGRSMEATGRGADTAGRGAETAGRGVETSERSAETAGRGGSKPEAALPPIPAQLTDIRREEALRYLGFRGKEIPKETAEAVDRWRERLLRELRPRAVWRLFDLLPDGSLSGAAFRPAGEDIARLLAPCRQAILMAATLGAEAEALLRRLQARSLSEAMVLDALESAAIENVCDNLCAGLSRVLAPRQLTMRFSPGYGDFPLSQQAELFRVLDVTRRIGVTLTPGGLMLPQKSVTAVIGVTEEAVPPAVRADSAAPAAENCGKRTDCAGCRLSGSCAFRRGAGEAWDPDFTKLTPDETARLNEAENSGFLDESEIDWEHLERYQ